MRVSVILPAAGLGTRMAAGHTPQTAPKQFLELAGTPILIRTLRAFAEVPEVSELVVAVRVGLLRARTGAAGSVASVFFGARSFRIAVMSAQARLTGTALPICFVISLLLPAQR